jgi:hypothetical protein
MIPLVKELVLSSETFMRYRTAGAMKSRISIGFLSI